MSTICAYVSLECTPQVRYKLTKNLGSTFSALNSETHFLGWVTELSCICWGLYIFCRRKRIVGVDNVAAIPLSCEVITHSIISPLLISLKPPASSSLPPKGFCPKGKIPRRHSRLVARAYIKESTLSWNIQSVCQKKSRFVWTGAAWNCWWWWRFYCSRLQVRDD